MFKLLEKSEISGTCWVELNVSGSSQTYEHWQPSSRYASLGAMQEVYHIFSFCIKDFDLYSPILIESQKAKEVSVMLDAFASSNPKGAIESFASQLSFFIDKSIADTEFIWVLGV